jgi:hypothetical protein
MKQFILLLLIAFSFALPTQAQTINSSPFKHIPPPQKVAGIYKATLANNSITAYRFVLPFAGFSPITKQISTGIGYGWNKLHWVDSTATYYTDVSIFGAIFVNGSIDTPSPYNFTSVGVGVGVLNDLIMIVPSYNLPTSQNKRGAFDFKISFGLTLK